MSINLSQKQRGYSLVEALLALASFAIISTAMLGLIIAGRQSLATSTRHLKALRLAQEGISAVRNMRDTSYSNLIDGTHGVTNSTGVWKFSGNSDNTEGFSRSAQIATVDSTTKKIEVTINWQQTAQRTGKLKLTTLLTNWKAPVVTTPPSFHVSYYDVSNKNLKYATCSSNCTTSTNWSLVTVDNANDVGHFSRIFVEGNNRHIVYQDKKNERLMYATCSNNCVSSLNWSKVALDSNKGGFYSDVTASGSKIMIAYYNDSTKTLRYGECNNACNLAGSWSFISADATTKRGKHATITHHNANPRISYFDENNGDLMYAECNNSCSNAQNWVAIKVDTTGSAGLFTSISINNGKPRISYKRDNGDRLRYTACENACSNPGNWTSTNALSPNDVGNYTSLSFFGLEPRIGHYDATSRDALLSFCSTNCTSASAWNHTVIDGTRDVGEYTALDINGSTHALTYYDSTGKDLKISICTASCTNAINWTKLTIDTVGDVGWYTSVNVR